MGSLDGEAMVAIFIMVAIPIAIGFFAFWLIKKSFTNLNNQLSILARNLGLHYNKPSSNWDFIWGKYPTIEGNIKGIPFYGYMYSKGSGKNQVTYTAFTLTLEGKNLTGKSLTVYKEGFFSKIGKAFGGQDIQIGNEDFDKNYIIKSNDEFFAKKALHLKVRQILLRKMPNMGGVLLLEGNKLNYDAVTTLVNDSKREDWEAVIGVFVELANEFKDVL